MSRGRFRYSLRFLLLITLVVAVVASVVNTQLKGRIQTRSDPAYFTDFSWTGVDISTGLSPTLAFSCATEDEAERVLTEFDETWFRGLVESHLKQLGASSDGAQPMLEVSTLCFRTESTFLIKYDFCEWGRYRLDPRHMRYSFDSSDPVAASRNEAIHRAFQLAGKAFAEKRPEILDWGHNP